MVGCSVLYIDWLIYWFLIGYCPSTSVSFAYFPCYGFWESEIARTELKMNKSLKLLRWLRGLPLFIIGYVNSFNEYWIYIS